MGKRKRTTHVRIYTDDVNNIKLRFPNVRMADFFHMSIKTNPFIQAEATLRKNKKKSKL
jgi:hypothetical protein